MLQQVPATKHQGSFLCRMFLLPRATFQVAGLRTSAHKSNTRSPTVPTVTSVNTNPERDYQVLSGEVCGAQRKVYRYISSHFIGPFLHHFLIEVTEHNIIGIPYHFLGGS